MFYIVFFPQYYNPLMLGILLSITISLANGVWHAVFNKHKARSIICRRNHKKVKCIHFFHYFFHKTALWQHAGFGRAALELTHRQCQSMQRAQQALNKECKYINENGDLVHDRKSTQQAQSRENDFKHDNDKYNDMTGT